MTSVYTAAFIIITLLKIGISVIVIVNSAHCSQRMLKTSWLRHKNVAQSQNQGDPRTPTHS